ncbi:MAG TPA: endonuclease/exonuclease/phosphatase family protein [Geothrix sp.]
MWTTCEDRLRGGPDPLARLAALGLIAGLLACGGSGTTVPPPSVSVSVPARGGSATLDLATWNLDWFGDPLHGPADDGLQVRNVRAVLAGLDCDLWGLEEVVDGAAFQTLLAGLPGYAGLLASDPRVGQGAAYYGPAEQKVALVYKTSLATLEAAQLILVDHAHDFAGRPPLEARFHMTLNGSSGTLFVIVLHAKAGADAASWQRRTSAAAALKAYLDTVRPQDLVVVLGDFNDDLDTSIAAGQPSPYQAFAADSARYFMPTRALSDAGTATFLPAYGFSDPIDHQVVSAAWAARYQAGSAEAFRADQYVGSYVQTTTDHRPVITRWTGF